jgi:hypothetical protein
MAHDLFVSFDRVSTKEGKEEQWQWRMVVNCICRSVLTPFNVLCGIVNAKMNVHGTAFSSSVDVVFPIWCWLHVLCCYFPIIWMLQPKQSRAKSPLCLAENEKCC